MAIGFHVISLVLILGLVLFFSVTSGENCPVNPDCSCSGSYVNCAPKCGPNIPKFVASSKKFVRVSIKGVRFINQIRPRSFQGLSMDRLEIQNTGIIDVACDAFNGISNGLHFLDLGHNYLRTVPTCSFQHVKSVTTLELTGNNISHLTGDAFTDLSNLNRLYLDQNQIESIEQGTFNTLSKLTYINVDRNQLTHLDGSMFEGLNSLQNLLLSRSQIKMVHPKSFDGLKSLIELKLDENKISALDVTTFENLIKIEVINLGNNTISSLPDKIFSKSVNLKTLDLRDNQLVSLPFNIFQTTPKMRYLYIQRNNMTELSHIFSFTPDLRTLDITENRIANLEPGTFKGIRYMYEINLNDNQLTTIQPDVFNDLDNLIRVKIVKNKIRHLEPGCFRNLPRLYEINLNDNQLTTIQRDVFNDLDSLSRVKIVNNKIRHLEPGCFRNLPNLNWIDLRENYIDEIKAGVFMNLTRLSYLYLANNRLSLIEKESLQNLPNLYSLDLSKNYIDEIKADVFTNSTNLRSLNLANNRLSHVENDSFESQRKSLSTLNLRSNKLSNKSWVMLTAILTNLDNLNNLDLSHNLMGDLPLPVVDLLENYRTLSLSLRNCSLTSFPSNEKRYNNLDLSANNLKRNGNVSTYIISNNLNISHNNLKSITVILGFPSQPYVYINVVDAQQNEINSIHIDISDAGYASINSLQFSNNNISNALSMTANRFIQDVYINTLDLSFNKFNTVIEFPFWANSSIDFIDHYITLSTLNLSHNNISFVSPFAQLGLINSLDLSYNRIEVFDRLLPDNRSSSDFTTSYLDLSGNRIHRIDPAALSGHELVMQTINLANNYLTEIHNLRNVVERPSFQRLYFLGNPLHCGCESSWLRQEAVSSKLDSARCFAPGYAKDYIYFCYPLKNCSPNQTIQIPASVWDLCKTDNTIIISSLKVIVLETVGISSPVNVSWTRHGHGQITGYKLEITPYKKTEQTMTSLVHLSEVYYIVAGLELEMTYNICISAQTEEVTASETLCSTLKRYASEDKVIIRKSILIGISSALGISVLFVLCVFVAHLLRRPNLRCCQVKDSKMNSTLEGQSRTAKPGNDCLDFTNTHSQCSNRGNNSNGAEAYDHPSNVDDGFDDDNQYEAINTSAYENFSSTTEEEERV